MEPESSFPYSQVPATCPYPEPARSSPYPHIPLPEDPSSALNRLLTFHVPNLTSLFRCLGPRQVFMIRNKISFYGDELSTTRTTLKLEDHPLSAVRYCLLNIFAATLYTRGRTSIRNLRTRHAVVTGTHGCQETG